MKLFALSVSVVLASFLTPQASRAQSSAPFAANLSTTVSTTQSSPTNRFYVNATTLAPVTTTIWVVGDTLRDGVSTNPPANRILGADDRLLHTDTVPGSLTIGNLAGRFQRNGISISGITPATTDIYVYLWNGQGTGFTPVQGSTFGLYKLGTIPPPEVGNAVWRVATNVFANQYQVKAAVADPQPSQLAGVTTTLANGTNFLQFTFTTEASVNYRVQSATNLVGNPTINWQDEDPAIVGTGSPANWLSVIKTNGVPVDLQKYFRVVAQ